MPKRAEAHRFLQVAHSMRAQIQRFAEGVRPSNEASLAIDGHGRDSELRVAIEELRAQNETLFDACSRLELEIAKYRDLYDGAPGALVTTDVRGVIADANRATAALFDFPLEMLTGKLLIAFVVRGDTLAFRDGLRAIVAGTGNGSFSVRVRPRGGEPVPARFAVRAVHPRRGGNGEKPALLHWSIHRD